MKKIKVRNLVAKHARDFNKSSVYIDRKKAEKKAGSWEDIDQGILEEDEGRCPECGSILPTRSVHSKDFCDYQRKEK